LSVRLAVTLTTALLLAGTAASVSAQGVGARPDRAARIESRLQQREALRSRAAERAAEGGKAQHGERAARRLERRQSRGNAPTPPAAPTP
jgi:hypothetical protein